MNSKIWPVVYKHLHGLLPTHFSILTSLFSLVLAHTKPFLFQSFGPSSHSLFTCPSPFCLQGSAQMSLPQRSPLSQQLGFINSHVYFISLLALPTLCNYILHLCVLVLLPCLPSQDINTVAAKNLYVLLTQYILDVRCCHHIINAQWEIVK